MRTALQLERWRASTDGLTGVLNKASFYQRMAAAVAAANGSDRAFILCYMDLDGFKQINDRHGHSAGDEILRLFATAAVDAIRERDLFARIGGDEFVALLSIGASEDGDYIAALVHQRLSSILARTGLPVGCSMGALIATAAQLEPIEAAVQLADSLMYEVKRSGKNALRVGRIDPAKPLTAPDCLEIRSDPATNAGFGQRSAVMVADRRPA
jgi:diguanylate cyclase (GGDEF)-like protein